MAANNRVGLEDNEYGDEAVNFYGSSYAVGPDGNYVGEVGSTSENQLLIRDPRRQRELLDLFAGRDVLALRTGYAADFAAWSN